MIPGAFLDDDTLVRAARIADYLAKKGEPQVLVLVFPPNDSAEWVEIQKNLQRYIAGEIHGFVVGRLP